MAKALGPLFISPKNGRYKISLQSPMYCILYLQGWAGWMKMCFRFLHLLFCFHYFILSPLGFFLYISSVCGCIFPASGTIVVSLIPPLTTAHCSLLIRSMQYLYHIFTMNLLLKALIVTGICTVTGKYISK